MPVDTLYRPRPSILSTARIAVSCVLRSIAARLMPASFLPSRFLSVSRAARLSRRSVCSCQPAVMRTQPSQPKSEDRSRTRIPRARIPRTKSAWLGPIRASTKFAWLGQKGIPRTRNSSSNRLRLALYFAHIAANVFLIGQRCRQAGQRHSVHVVGRAGPPQTLYLFRRARQHAHSANSPCRRPWRMFAQ